MHWQQSLVLALQSGVCPWCHAWSCGPLYSASGLWGCSQPACWPYLLTEREHALLLAEAFPVVRPTGTSEAGTWTLAGLLASWRLYNSPEPPWADLQSLQRRLAEELTRLWRKASRYTGQKTLTQVFEMQCRKSATLQALLAETGDWTGETLLRHGWPADPSWAAGTPLTVSFEFPADSAEVFFRLGHEKLLCSLSST